MSILIRNIKTLVSAVAGDTLPKQRVAGKNMSQLNCIDNAFLLIEDGIIKDFGKMNDLKSEIDNPNRSNDGFRPNGGKSEIKRIDASGKFVFPCWCDSHTHIVYAASREKEFVDRVQGLSYQKITKRGGGIFSSVKKVRESSEEELLQSALRRLNEIMMQGTGAVEIKSGYGLNVKDELKMLHVIKKLKSHSPLTIKATFLGAHAIPGEYKSNKEKYIELIIKEWIPRIAEERLADYCDVFCEEGYFSKEETIQILQAASANGLVPKVHAEQLSHSGGIEAGVECKAVSVDHLEFANDHDIALLKNSLTMPTILPGAQFFLRLPRPPVRNMIDAGLPVAIASDYNPGTSPTGNMNLLIALACIQYKLLPEEAINAATINSAYAMGLSQSHGSIAKEKKANVFITKEIPSLAFLPYAFGSNLIETVIVNGEIQTIRN